MSMLNADEDGKSCMLPLGMQNDTTSLELSLEFFMKLNICIGYDSATVLYTE